MNFQIEHKQVKTQDNSYAQCQLADVAASCAINTRPNTPVAFVDRKCVIPMIFCQKLYQSHEQEIAEEFELAIKANSLEKIKKLESVEFFRRSSEKNIHYVFKRVREGAPCILVLEDIDFLTNKENRSLFLNQLDGFTSNQGVMILSTANHSEQIDPAIINRPSRFDRKYYFELSALTERVDYINLWNDKFKLPMCLSAESNLQKANSVRANASKFARVYS